MPKVCNGAARVMLCKCLCFRRKLKIINHTGEINIDNNIALKYFRAKLSSESDMTLEKTFLKIRLGSGILRGLSVTWVICPIQLRVKLVLLLQQLVLKSGNCICRFSIFISYINA